LCLDRDDALFDRWYEIGDIVTGTYDDGMPDQGTMQ
jgi:hypothetical protein